MYTKYLQVHVYNYCKYMYTSTASTCIQILQVHVYKYLQVHVHKYMYTITTTTCIQVLRVHVYKYYKYMYTNTYKYMYIQEPISTSKCLLVLQVYTCTQVLIHVQIVYQHTYMYTSTNTICEFTHTVL